MENIKNKINYIYRHLFNTPIHPFFNDLLYVDKMTNKYTEYNNKFIKKTITYKQLNEYPPTIDVNNSNEIVILTNNDLIELNKELSNQDNFDKIFKIITKISKYTIESNVKNEDTIYKKMDTDKINCMIIGSGPVGLFLACYLDLYYNRGSLNNYPKINIVMYDSRLEKPGFRKPYTRIRPFNTHSHYLSYIVPKIYCLNPKIKTLFINIFILEYLLFTKARIDHNIPMIYRDYSWNEYLDIIENNNIDVVFDCTGGRLKTNVFRDIDTSWLNNIEKVNMKLMKQLSILPDKNLVEIIDYPKDNKFKKNHFYGSLVVVNDNMDYIKKYDIDIMNEKDLQFLSNIKNKKYNYNSILQIIQNIVDDNSRNFLYNMISDNNYTYYFDVWTIYIRHTIQPAEIINNKTLYIMAGDSIFHSHFITGAGLNRTIDFAVKCANMLIDIKL